MSDLEQRVPRAATHPVPGPISPLRLSLWLAVVLIGAKAVLLGAPHSWIWPLDLALISFRDVLFAVVVGLAGEIILRALKTARPALQRLARGLFIGFCVLCALYGVISVGVFEYFQRPLTFDLLRLIRDITAVRSSITEQITLRMWLALIGVPAALLAIALRSWRQQNVPLIALGIVAAWILAGWARVIPYPNYPKARVHLSPHFELARSMVVALGGKRKVTFDEDFPPEDERDFRSFKARADEPRGGFTPAAGVTRPRNVIVIILESVGTKYLSLYGSPYDTTPNLVAEAANSAVFNNCYAQAPYTYSSFMAVNFSSYPGLPWLYMPWAGRPCPPSLATILHPSGSRTGYFHNGDLYWGSMRWLLEQQTFDQVLDYRGLGCGPLTSWGAEDRCVVDRLIRWIDEKPGQPFFATCWTDQTHHPYELSPGQRPIDFFQGHPPRSLAPELARYLNLVRGMDAQLGKLFAELRKRGLADDTLVAITGDHGEAFCDPHDQRGHSFTIYEEDVHVPLILWNPRLFAGGRRVESIGSHIDILPTIADLLGVEPAAGWQGHSVFAPSHPPRAFFMTNIGEYLFGVREDEWKYFLNATGGDEYLFDLARDPDEQANIAPAEVDRCRRFRQRIAAWVSFEEKFLRGQAD